MADGRVSPRRVHQYEPLTTLPRFVDETWPRRIEGRGSWMLRHGRDRLDSPAAVERGASAWSRPVDGDQDRRSSGSIPRVSLAGDLDRVFRPVFYRIRSTRLTSHEERHAQRLGGVLTHELYVPLNI